jgi:hypothetical protein
MQLDEKVTMDFYESRFAIPPLGDIIFDVDGTLANCEHRQHFVRSKPRNWKAFNSTIGDDSVHWDIVWLARLFYSVGCRILICTARTDDLREATKNWLDKKAGLEGIYEKIYMRGEKDYRDDSIVKRELLDEIRNDGYDPVMVLDDRDRVVKIWREAGLRCLQVAPGDF